MLPVNTLIYSCVKVYRADEVSKNRKKKTMTFYFAGNYKEDVTSFHVTRDNSLRITIYYFSHTLAILSCLRYHLPNFCYRHVMFSSFLAVGEKCNGRARPLDLTRPEKCSIYVRLLDPLPAQISCARDPRNLSRDVTRINRGTVGHRAWIRMTVKIARADKKKWIVVHSAWPLHFYYASVCYWFTHS